MEKRSIIIYLIIAIALLALIALYLLFFRGTEVVVIQPETIEDCSSIEGNYIRDSCYVQIAVNDVDETICANIADADEKDLCYIRIARLTENREICAKVVDLKYSKPKCYGEVTILSNQ
jgi:flagellar basal body-associated protein FliL